MTSPRRSKKSDAQCALQNSLDWDSPSAATGTVKRRRSSDPEASSLHPFETQESILEVQTPSDSGSGTSRSIDDSDKTDSHSLVEVEQRISCIINENRSSQSNSECSEADFIIDSLLANPNDEDLFTTAQDEAITHTRGKTFIKTSQRHEIDTKCATNSAETIRNKSKERKLKPPLPIPKLNRSLDLVKSSTKLPKEIPKPHDKTSVLPIYRSTVQGQELDLSVKKKVGSKLRLPFSPVRTMDKPKMNFFQSKTNTTDSKHSPLLSSPVRRTISNEYVRLKFTNDTLVRRTIDGKSVPKIMPKIQSIIPESPVDSEDPFLNLSPNKKYTVTVNNRVRCDKDNYVIFDPGTGFKPDEAARQSRIPLKSPSSSDKSRIPIKSPVGERPLLRQTVNVSDTDSGILSPNSPVETSADEASAYVNAAAFRATAKKCVGAYDIKILDPGLAKKAAEQIKLVLAALVALAAGKPSAPGYYPGYSSVAYPAAPVAYSSPVYSPPVAYASPVSYASQVAYRAPFTYSAPSYTAPVAYSPAYPAAPVAYSAAPVAYPAAPVAYSAPVASVPVAYSPVTYAAAPVKAPVYGAAYAPYAGYYLKK